MGTYNHGYKFRIYPTKEQTKRLDEFIDVTRAVYNWGIEKENEIFDLFKQGKSKNSFYTFFMLRSLFRQELKTNPEWQWLKDMNIPFETASLPLRNVENGFKRYFKHISNRPHFKSKKRCKKSFNTRYDRFNIENNCIKIEGIKDRISLNFDSQIEVNGRLDKEKPINPVITRDNLGNYYISFSLKEEVKSLDVSKSEGIGIDLGIKKTFTLSTGEVFIQPKEKLEKLERELKKLQKHVSRDIKRRKKEADRTRTKYEDIPKSKRAIKRETKLLKTYKKIHNIKDTFYHTVTKRIVERNPEFVCIESFSVMEIQKNEPYMNDKISIVSFYDITRKIKDKCKKYGIKCIQASKDFPSTKTCSNCGSIKEMNGRRNYRCPICGMVEDRDINAAINLKNYGLANYSNNMEILE